jgi:hypothetical protein
MFSRILSHPEVSEIWFRFSFPLYSLLFVERNLLLDDLLNLQVIT